MDGRSGVPSRRTGCIWRDRSLALFLSRTESAGNDPKESLALYSGRHGGGSSYLIRVRGYRSSHGHSDSALEARTDPMTQNTPVLAGCLPRASALTRGTLAWAALAVFAPSPLLAQLQFDELRKRHLPPRFLLAGTVNPLALAFSDVDGDGDADLVLGMCPVVSGNSGKNMTATNGASPPP